MADRTKFKRKHQSPRRYLGALRHGLLSSAPNRSSCAIKLSRVLMKRPVTGSRLARPIKPVDQGWSEGLWRDYAEMGLLGRAPLAEVDGRLRGRRGPRL